MIHTDTPFWLDFILTYGIYLLGVFIIRCIYYKQGYAYLLKHIVFDIIFFFILHFIVEYFNMKLVYIIYILVFSLLRERLIEKRNTLKYFLIETSFTCIGFLLVLAASLLEMYINVGHI